ncbi:MAG: tyrosine-type recombinase/integrase [candidate division Zixibacteria bacterium]
MIATVVVILHKGFNLTSNKETVLRNFGKFVGDVALKSVDRQLIDEYIRYRLQEKTKRNNSNISKSTVNLELRHLKAIFNTAVSWNVIKRNPFKSVKLLRVPESECPKYLTVDEISNVREAFIRTEWQHIVNFYLWTGVRLQEALTLSWSDIDFKNRTITIKSINSKSKRNRFIGFNPDGELGEMLLSLKKRKDNKIFGPQSANGIEKIQWKLDTVSRNISRVCTHIGLDWASCHTFRHTFASHLVMAGVPRYTVKELLGHSTIKTTEIYAHLAAQHKSDMIAKLPY